MKTAYYDGPLVVLVNRLSASASEIFAGAIQDYERGIIVGDRSFGKGTVQSLIRLPEGQLKITESKFYRISGESTQHRGVVPDITFPSLFDAEEIGESSLDHALSWDQINPIRHRRYDDFSSVLPEVSAQFRKRSEGNPDFIFLEDQIALAQKTRELTSLPLNEQQRKALRQRQEDDALAIENKRRKAKGEPALASLEEPLDDVEADDVLDGEASEEDEETDVLLQEASNVLADMLHLRRQRYAVHHGTAAYP
jgi:carboxyl-terminal processing protease